MGRTCPMRLGLRRAQNGIAKPLCNRGDISMTTSIICQDGIQLPFFTFVAGCSAWRSYLSGIPGPTDVTEDDRVGENWR